MNSNNVDKACLEILETAAVGVSAVKSTARPGLLNTLFAIFFRTFNHSYLDF